MKSLRTHLYLSPSIQFAVLTNLIAVSALNENVPSHAGPEIFPRNFVNIMDADVLALCVAMIPAAIPLIK